MAKSKIKPEVKEIISKSYEAHSDMGSAALTKYLNESSEAADYREKLKSLGVEKVTRGMVIGAVGSYHEKAKAASQKSRNRKQKLAENGEAAAEPSAVAATLSLKRNYESLTDLANDLDNYWKAEVEAHKDYMPQMKEIDEAAEKVGGATRNYKKNRNADEAVALVKKQVEEFCKRVEAAQAEMKALDPSKDADLARSVYGDQRVLNKACKVIDNSDIPDTNKEILKAAVESRFEELKGASEGSTVAKQVRQTLETAQALVPKAAAKKPKRKKVNEKMIEDDKAFIKESVEMFYEDGADPTAKMVYERAKRLGYPFKEESEAYVELENAGAIERKGFGKDNSLVYVPKGKEPYGQIFEKPQMPAKPTDEELGRIHLSDTIKVNIEEKGDKLVVNGKELPLERFMNEVADGAVTGDVQLIESDLERKYHVKLDKNEQKELGYWIAGKMAAARNKDPKNYRVKLWEDGISVSEDTVAHQTEIVGKRKGRRDD